MPAICEFYDIPCTASDPLTLSLALDKSRAKEVFLARGVPTPAWTVLSNGRQLEAGWEGGAGPWIVKPLFEGSSKGIPARAFCTEAGAVAQRVSEIAAEYGQPALVEEFLPGRETVSLASHGLRCLEVGHATIPVEFEPDAHESRVLVRIRVPDGQPPGLYSDTLLHAATGESVGTLSLKLR